MPWCECDKCDGGKNIPQSTWFWHKKKMKLTPEVRGRPRNERRNPPPNVAPIDLVDPPEEEDEQEDDDDVIQSDVVSVMMLILSALVRPII